MDVGVGVIVINKNKKNYQVKGVLPSFYNDGNTDVRFLERTLAPGKEATLNFGNHQVNEKFDITFIPTNDPSNDRNRLVIHTGVPKMCNE
jgi:hypothetical protein